MCSMEDYKMKSKCSICNSEIKRDNGDIVGELGVYPVAFCAWCKSSIIDMVIEIGGFDDIETLEERIRDLKDDM